MGIARSKRLDLCIGQGGFIHILAGTDRAFAGHDLRNETLLILNGLPHIRIEGILSNIAEDLDLFVLIALPEYSAFPLLDVAGPPGNIQVMLCNEQFLHVGSCAHLDGGAEQDTHITCPHIGKQGCFLRFGLGFMNICDLIFGNACLYELLPYIIVHIELPVPMRGR